jgi:hypothetical protein
MEYTCTPKTWPNSLIQMIWYTRAVTPEKNKTRNNNDLCECLELKAIVDLEFQLSIVSLELYV